VDSKINEHNGEKTKKDFEESAVRLRDTWETGENFERAKKTTDHEVPKKCIREEIVQGEHKQKLRNAERIPALSH